jgi:uncharacterized protein (DUF934 family)
MRIIENREIREDAYTRVLDDEPLPASGDVIVSLTRWRADRETLIARAGRIGVRCSGETEPEELAPDFACWSVIALELPKFTDGRAYSTARLLRERHGWRGQLRAVGDVLEDQLFYLSRVGFDAFELKPGKSLESAVRAFTTFSVVYQPGADEKQPLWRRVRRPAEPRHSGVRAEGAGGPRSTEEEASDGTARAESGA